MQEFLQLPVKKMSGGAENLQCPSNVNSDVEANTNSFIAEAVIPKRVKSGVVTKRSTVSVTNNRCLEVKVNVTGQSLRW